MVLKWKGTRFIRIINSKGKKKTRKSDKETKINLHNESNYKVYDFQEDVNILKYIRYW